MSNGRLLSWAFVGLMTLVPLNWLRLWAIGGLPTDTTVSQLLFSIVICWSIAAGLGYFLAMSARGIKMNREKEEIKLQQMLLAPLVEIKPSQALIRPDEKAYGSVMAHLQENRTVGYAPGAAGVSIRVAKGFTVRTRSTRDTAIKEMVNVAFGELVVTDKRIVFSGDRKSFAIPLGDLLNATNYDDGFGFSNNDVTYTLVTRNDSDRMRFAIALNKVLRT